MPSSDKARRAGYSKKFQERRKEDGQTRTNLWLTQEGTEALEFLLESSPGMSKSDIVNRALRYLAIRMALDKRELDEVLKGTGEFPAP